MLSLAAQEADIVGFNRKLNADATIDASERTEAALERKVAWVREAAGERFASLELNVEVRGVAITADRRQAAAEYVQGRIDHAGAISITPKQLLADPYWLIGSVEQIVDQVRHLREAYGISYVMVHSEDMEAFAPVVAQLAGQ
jgi:alkanesulfonate monooxygenase SsuD/methylene tetrahydromethanopterin reductase-like flavin-dependent oxidoreductase (luciferase family)